MPDKETQPRDHDDTRVFENRDVRAGSDIHSNVDTLIQTKDTTLRDNYDKIERREIVYSFTNLRDTLTEEEMNETGREEITNFGSTFRAAQSNIAPLEAIVLGTDSLCEVSLDFNDANRDHLVAQEIANEANKWFFTDNERFHEFWRTCVGEGYISGGGAAIFDEENSGLFPRYNRHLYFPRGAKLDPEEMTYCFERRELSLADLHELLAEADDDDETIQVSSIQAMIEHVHAQIIGQATKNVSSRVGIDLNDRAARDNFITERATFEVWGYWEVRTYPDDYKDKKKRGLKYVSHIMFIDTCVFAPAVHADVGIRESEETIDAHAIVTIEEVAYEDPREWMVMMIFDEEIGGEKTVDTLRGIGEAFYKPAVLLEELRNVEIEGAMQSARLTLQAEEGADIDEVLDFQLGRDAIAPSKLNILQLPNTGSQMRPIVNDLLQTTSSIASSSISNNGRGGELRQQAVERQAGTETIKGNKISKAYAKVNQLLDIIVGRGLTLNPAIGTEDYRIIKGFQEAVDMKIADIYGFEDEESQDAIDDPKKAKDEASKIREKIGKRSYGKFKYLSVKARRNSTGVDRSAELENADFILRMLEAGYVNAANREVLLERAVAYQTQNPDLAKLISAKPEVTKADQRERASAEFATIIRRVAAGEILPIGARDVDEDHVEAHILDTIALVNKHGLRPWDQLNVAEFTGIIEHTSAHLERMRSRPESGKLAKEKMLELQEIVKQAGAIIQILEEERAEQEQQELSPQDRLAIAKEQKTYAEIEALGRKLGADIENTKGQMKQRLDRERQNQDRFNLLNRQSIVKEIKDQREFQLKQAQLEIQRESQKQQTARK